MAVLIDGDQISFCFYGHKNQNNCYQYVRISVYTELIPLPISIVDPKQQRARYYNICTEAKRPPHAGAVSVSPSRPHGYYENVYEVLLFLADQVVIR